MGIDQSPEACEPSWERAFEELFWQTMAPFVNTLIRIVGDRGQAEELSAEAFCRLYKQRPDRRGQQNHAGWVYRVAMHLALDALRSNVRRLHRETEAESVTSSAKVSDALQDLLAEEQRARVRSVLARLKPAQAKY